MRIGFLFNHNAGHQVAHALPIAAAMARDYPQADLRIMPAAGAAEAEVRRLWQTFGHAADDPRIVVLQPAGGLARAATALTGGALPADRVDSLRVNLHHFADCDALVVPEKTSTLLKTRFGLRDLALVHSRHGAGDRAIGFDKASARFDLVLVSGPKIRDRLQAAGLLKAGGHAITGYAKFDLLRDAAPVPPLFDNGRPTVLYNPHPSPSLSSWYAMGQQVLEWFAAQDRFNLIFAPHIMLFAKRMVLEGKPLRIARVPQVADRYRSLPHIHIDTGSRASVDMTYTRAADIYVGDASSQVYEFLYQPRPCLFLDPAWRQWQGDADFAHWQAGPVVSDVAGMERALNAAMADPHSHADVQRRLFSYSFDVTERPSGDRAAAAIVDWLDRNRATGWLDRYR